MQLLPLRPLVVVFSSVEPLVFMKPAGLKNVKSS